MVRTSLSSTIAFLFLISFSNVSRAEILFEGYSKILSGGVHVGYVVARYEFDNQKKIFTATSFLKIQQLNGGITESIKATASEDLKPLSYSYTALVGATTKVIDAKFEKNKMVATVKEGGKVVKVSNDLPKGIFLSSFLGYVILKSPQGLKAETKYEYQAIAEEDAKIEKGIAVVKNAEPYSGIKAFRILNDFKGTKFVSYMTEKGEVLSTKSPAQSIATELVATAAEATAKFNVSQALLSSLFGGIPEGKENAMTRAALNSATSTAPPPAQGAAPHPLPPGFAPPPGKGFIDPSQHAEPLESGNAPAKKSK